MKVWMVLEDDDGTRHGFEIDQANVDHWHKIEDYDDIFAQNHFQRGLFTAQWAITTHRPYRRYWPPTAPAQPADDITRSVEITAGQPPRETNDSASAFGSTD